MFSTRSTSEIKIQRTSSLRLACARKISPRYRRWPYRGRYRRARFSPFSYWMRAYRKRGRVNSVPADLRSLHAGCVFRESGCRSGAKWSRRKKIAQKQDRRFDRRALHQICAILDVAIKLATRIS